jgi:hypothetical protein
MGNQRKIKRSGRKYDVRGAMTNDGVLTIEGTGATPDFMRPSDSPFYAYRGNVISAIVLDGVTRLGDYAIYGAAFMKSVTIADSVRSIGKRAFAGCGCLKSIVIPNSVTKIGDYAFAHCTALESVALPDPSKSGSGVPQGDCRGLTSVELEESGSGNEEWIFFDDTRLPPRTTIGDNIFAECPNLREVTSTSRVPPFTHECSFCDVPLDTILYVPDGCSRNYMSVADWSFFVAIKEID